MRYRDRLDAGQHLAEQLRRYANRPDILVLALPRGGVPVGSIRCFLHHQFSEVTYPLITCQ